MFSKIGVKCVILMVITVKSFSYYANLKKMGTVCRDTLD